MEITQQRSRAKFWILFCAVILVVAQNTSSDAVQLAGQRLAEDGSLLLGTILNNWNPKNSSRGYADYRGYEKAYASQA